jgi:hypothetical protein
VPVLDKKEVAHQVHPSGPGSAAAALAGRVARVRPGLIDVAGKGPPPPRLAARPRAAGDRRRITETLEIAVPLTAQRRWARRPARRELARLGSGHALPPPERLPCRHLHRRPGFPPASRTRSLKRPDVSLAERTGNVSARCGV